MLDVERDIERQAFAVGPGEGRPVDDGRIIIAPVRLQLHGQSPDSRVIGENTVALWPQKGKNTKKGTSAPRATDSAPRFRALRLGFDRRLLRTAFARVARRQ